MSTYGRVPTESALRGARSSRYSAAIGTYSSSAEALANRGALVIPVRD
jgi:hypothetical protein